MIREEMMQRMDAVEYRTWGFFFELEPFGDEWRQAGTVAAAMAGGNAEKYIPFPKPAQTSDEMEAVLMSTLVGLPKA